MKETLLKEFQRELDNEMGKPFSQRDTDRIERLTDMIYSLEFDEQGETEIEEAKERLIGKITTNAPVRRSVIRRLVPAAACAAILLGINQVSLSAYGENIFSRIYHYTGKGVAIHLEENPDTDTMPTGSSVITGTDIELSISESDPYGIKKKCAEYGIYPLTPSYIPKGFKLTEIETENDIKANAIRFSFVKGDETIELEYAQYKTDKMSVEIPSTSTSIIEKEICGRVFATIQEENSTKAFCADDVLLYGVFINGIDRQEADRILNSLR